MLISAHWACFDPLNLEQRLAWARGGAATLGERLNNPVVLAQALRMLGQDRLELATCRVRAAFDRADRIADELDTPFLRIFGPASRARWPP